ncbi:SWIM zinc finger domain-containing protein [Methanobrevibacter sp. DSM 116169]|uniref:SWIM zinc finger family protein n=1 Tax=Methanobrevibacter sp. DSM 116169 TaxID=3242727 RepID=UPI0038FC636E
MKINEFIEASDFQIIERGESYYHSGYVLSLSKKGNMFISNVEGSNYDPYKVKIILNDNEEITHYNCNCPYNYGPVCKHVIAVLLAILNNDFKEMKIHELKDTNKTSSIDQSRKLLERASKEELSSFLSEQLKDNNLRYEFLKFFNESFEYLFEEIKYQISCLIVNEYNNDDLDEIISKIEYLIEEFKEKLDKTNYEDIFNYSFEIFLESILLFEKFYYYDGLYDFHDIIDNSFEILEETIVLFKKYADKNSKNRALETLVRKGNLFNFHNHDMSKWDILNFAIEFVDKDNRNYFLNEIKYDESEILDFKLIEESLILKFDGEEELQKFRMNNIDLDYYREIIISQAIDNQNFELAEKLVLEKIEIEENYQVLKKWNYLLFNIYKKSNFTDKQMEIANNLLKKGHHEYFYILKDFYINNNTWDEKREDLLKIAQKNLFTNDYLNILESEEEWDKLLKAIEKNNMFIFDFIPNLIKYRFKEINQLIEFYILEKAQFADTRHKYRKLCNEIQKVNDFDLKDLSFKMIDDIKNSFPNKPALNQELDFLKMKLNR